MADKIQRPAGPKPGTLHGIIIRSTIDAGFILKTTLPELDTRFLVVGTKDIPGATSIDVTGDRLDVFASSVIEYHGQPILALFGPDAETIEVKSRDIEVEYQLPGADKSVFKTQTAAKTRLHEASWGDMVASMATAASVVERTYVDRKERTRESIVKYVRCTPVDRQLRLEMATQWPFFVRNAVAATCAVNLSDVVVVPQPYYTTRDEYMMDSTVMACIAALAALKSKRPVQLGSRYPTCKGAYYITRKTALDVDKKPIAEDIVVMVDQGASPLFTDEMFNQMKAGLVPFYPLQACSVRMESIASEDTPSSFYGDLGYSAAIFSTEAHASALAREAQMNPANWRLKHYADTHERNKVVATLPMAKLKDLIAEVGAASDFSRHSAVYGLQRRIKNPMSIFLNYSRGIALACAPGLYGLSADFPSLGRFSISVKLDTNNRVTVNTSHYPSEEVGPLWRKLIVRELGVDPASVSMLEGDTSNLNDSGPTVLLEDVTRASTMLLTCCRAIKARRFKDPLPIVETTTVQDILGQSGSSFTSGYWGAMAMELEVDTVNLQVEIRHIWCNLSFANALDKDSLEGSCRQTIISAVRGCQGVFSHKKGRETEIDLKIEDQGLPTAPTSANQALKGMVMACFTSALCQALNNEVATLPITGDDIVAYIRRNE